MDGVGGQEWEEGKPAWCSRWSGCIVLACSLGVSRKSLSPFICQPWSACCAQHWAPFLRIPKPTAPCVFPPRELPWLKVLLEVLHPGEEQVAQGMEGLTWEAICQRLTFPCWGNQG